MDPCGSTVANCGSMWGNLRIRSFCGCKWTNMDPCGFTICKFVDPCGSTFIHIDPQHCGSASYPTWIRYLKRWGTFIAIFFQNGDKIKLLFRSFFILLYFPLSRPCSLPIFCQRISPGQDTLWFVYFHRVLLYFSRLAYSFSIHLTHLDFQLISSHPQLPIGPSKWFSSPHPSSARAAKVRKTMAIFADSTDMFYILLISWNTSTICLSWVKCEIFVVSSDNVNFSLSSKRPLWNEGHLKVPNSRIILPNFCTFP